VLARRIVYGESLQGFGKKSESETRPVYTERFSATGAEGFNDACAATFAKIA
jgi:hypothetical protein